MTFFLDKIFYEWMNAMDVLCHIACVVAATLGKSNGCTLRTPQLYLHSISQTTVDSDRLTPGAVDSFTLCQGGRGMLRTEFDQKDSTATGSGGARTCGGSVFTTQFALQIIQIPQFLVVRLWTRLADILNISMTQRQPSR
jgi:hypothetical protein